MELVFLFVSLMFVLLFFERDALALLLCVWRPAAMRVWFDDSPISQRSISITDVLGEWLSQLRELGFSEIGVKVEKLPLWGHAFRAVSLVSAAAETYAGIVLHEGTPRSLYRYTPLRGAGLVFTRNWEPALEAEGEGLSVKNVPGHNFAEMLDSHEQRLRALKAAGFEPVVGLTPEARIEATRHYYSSTYACRFTVRSERMFRLIVGLLFLAAACALSLNSR